MITPRQRKRCTALVGLLALVAACAAVIVTTSASSDPLAPADARFFTGQLVRADQDVRTQLVRLGPSGSLAEARVHTRDAAAVTHGLAGFVRHDGGADAARLRVATGAELRFLDAVGSVLVNPRSPLLGRLGALDVAARDALAALDGPPGRRKGGVAALRRLRHSAGPAGREILD